MSEDRRAHDGESPASPAPLLVIEPGNVSIRRYAKDLVSHRDLILVLARRDIKLRYRQTALGVSWVVIQPVLAAGILAFVFGRIAKLPTDDVDSFLFTFAGMLAWTAVSGAMTRTTSSLIGNASLVSKVFFPRLILPLSTVASVGLDFLVGLVLVLLLLLKEGLAPGLPFLLAPVWLCVGLLIAAGVGLMLATMAVHYRDIPQITPVLLQLLLYASPVAYSVRAVPPEFATVYNLNPMSGVIQAFRWSVLETPFPPAWAIGYSVVLGLVLFGGGMLVLERKEQRFADVI